MPSNTMTILVFAELVFPKSGQKCQFIRFLEVITALNFFLDYKFQMQNYKSILSQINYEHIWSFSSAENVRFGLSTERSFDHFWSILLVFEAIFSIITKDNRLLDGCFGKLKRLPISNMTFIFNSNAQFWPKI